MIIYLLIGALITLGVLNYLNGKIKKRPSNDSVHQESKEAYDKLMRPTSLLILITLWPVYIMLCVAIYIQKKVNN